MQNERMNELETITAPELIREISNDPNFNRDFDQPTFAGNRTRLEQMLEFFSFHGRPLPTMCPRTDLERAKAQDQLWSKLDDIAKEVQSRSDRTRTFGRLGTRH